MIKLTNIKKLLCIGLSAITIIGVSSPIISNNTTNNILVSASAATNKVIVNSKTYKIYTKYDKNNKLTSTCAQLYHSGKRIKSVTSMSKNLSCEYRYWSGQSSNEKQNKKYGYVNIRSKVVNPGSYTVTIKYHDNTSEQFKIKVYRNNKEITSTYNLKTTIDIGATKTITRNVTIKSVNIIYGGNSVSTHLLNNNTKVVVTAKPKSSGKATVKIIYSDYVTETASFNITYTAPVSKNNVLWVGDSRTVGLMNTVGGKYIAEVGVPSSKLYDWRNEILKYTGYNIIFWMGVNGLDYGSYLNFLKTLPSDFIKHNKIYVMSVTPGNSKLAANYGMSINNNDIKAFNKIVKENLPSYVTYIDMYSKMTNNPTYWSTEDGVHYNNITYKNIRIWTKELTGL